MIFGPFSASVCIFRPYILKALGIHWGWDMQQFWSKWANFRVPYALGSWRNPYKCIYLLKENVLEYYFTQFRCSLCSPKRLNTLVNHNKHPKNGWNRPNLPTSTRSSKIGSKSAKFGQKFKNLFKKIEKIIFLYPWESLKISWTEIKQHKLFWFKKVVFFMIFVRTFEKALPLSVDSTVVCSCKVKS